MNHNNFYMKKLLISTLFVALSISAMAQKDVTTFLGIPVDGFKTEMRQKLISKGYSPYKLDDSECYEGEFNGFDVTIFIVTNNNKVYRLMVCDANTQSEADIKIRFNRLVSQFMENKRYVSFDDYTIPESEDISYEMLVHSKTYDAIFYQKPDMSKVDTLAKQEYFRSALLEKYTMEQLSNPTDEIIDAVKQVETQYALDLVMKKPVWFRINEHYGKYYISMFYDNEYNHANGEDL